MRAYRKALATTVAMLSLFVAACGTPAAVDSTPTAASVTVVSTPTTATAPATLAPATATTVATSTSSAAATPATGNATPTTAPATVAATSAASTDVIKYTVTANGTKADYRVREQLAKLNAPSDAVGTTTGVTGAIVLGADGKVVSDQSKVVVDLTSLQSDSGMRDGYIGRGTLETSKYPNATFVPTALTGLSAPLPTTGQQTFQMVGNLTIHGVTKPATWSVTTQVSGNDVTGQATTSFKFEDFGMTPPASMAVLSVVDNVKLEVSFHLVKSA